MRTRPSCKSVAILAVIAAGVGLATVTDADAARKRRSSEGTITAHSQYGNGSLTVPVRRGPHGMELRLPGGTWIGCEFDCAETLRRQKLDFWETLREDSPGGRD
ncbi:MAG: hypothetical protein KDJ41_08285 [Hyphomicrobiaceae bacterium]|nr:hypothetical protein [Hyphomicrobiaceae bacterium]